MAGAGLAPPPPAAGTFNIRGSSKLVAAKQPPETLKLGPMHAVGLLPEVRPPDARLRLQAVAADCAQERHPLGRRRRPRSSNFRTKLSVATIFVVGYM